MPVSMPDSLDPQAVSWTRNRPRNIVQSDFTGFTQMTLSGTTFLSGEFQIPPFESKDMVRDWQGFFGELEAPSNDGTFWVPLWSLDYDYDGTNNVSWANATIHSKDDRQIITASTSSSRALENQIGRNVQVRLRNTESASKVFTLIEYGTQGSGANAMVRYTFSEPLPFASDDLLSVNLGRKVFARALIPDPQAQTMTMDHLSGNVPGIIPWTEAVGHILQDIQSP